MYRKFWLENGAGDKYDLTNIDETGFLNQPSQLGATADLQLIRLGNSQKASSIQWQLVPIQGEVIFKCKGSNPEIYQEYRDFFDFTSKYPIYLHYQTPAMSNTSMFREVVLTMIEKTEISSEMQTLVCPIAMMPLTMWLDANEFIVEVDVSRDVGKKYSLKRPYYYSQSNAENVVLHNTSNMMIPIIVEIYGECIDPSYYLYDATGKLYGVGKFIGEFDYVYVNSNNLDEDIKLSNKGEYLPNATAYQDATIGIPNQTFLTFVYLRQGTNTMKFLFNNEFKGKVIVRYRGNYATV